MGVYKLWSCWAQKEISNCGVAGHRKKYAARCLCCRRLADQNQNQGVCAVPFVVQKFITENIEFVI
jgi:hypothetical protein